MTVTIGLEPTVIDTVHCLRGTSIGHFYGGARALEDVSFDVYQGEVHALIGENGAGKSTLVKVLTGTVRPAEGALSIDEHTLDIGSPAEAQAYRIGVVHQDYNLFPQLSVAANIVGTIPGVTPRHGPLTNQVGMHELARSLMADLGLDVDPRRPVAGLGADERKLIEIARAMVQAPRFLLLDEPTAALEPRETDRLLQVIRDLRDRGTGIILVSHRLGEISRVADRVTALRDGRKVGELPQSELTPRSMTVLMVGTELEEHDGPGHAPYGPRLQLRGFRARDSAEPVDLDVGRGEIVAVVGLVGSGCGAVLQRVAGVRKDRHSQLLLDGERIEVCTPSQAVRRGIGYAPEDRKRLGLVMGRSVAENMGLASLGRWSVMAFTRHRAMDRSAEQARWLFDIKCNSVRQPVSSLSGGNQQKVLLSRWNLAGAGILVLDEPTQGVDVSARRAIHDYLLGFAAEGGSVLLSSSDIDEVRAIAHRIYVLQAGEVSEVLSNTGDTRRSRTDLTEAVVSERPSAQKEDA